jgi:hypothetical protein
VCLAVVCAAFASGGCATTTHVTVDPPGAHLVVDDVAYGAVPVDGIDVTVARGVGDVPIRLLDENGALLVEGVLPRDEVAGWSWAIVGASAAIAACAAPACAAMALLVTNPTLAFAPVVALLNCSTAPFATVLAAPSCATIPVVVGAGLLGLTPSFLMFATLTPPRAVHISRAGVVHSELADGTMRDAPGGDDEKEDEQHEPQRY